MKQKTPNNSLETDAAQLAQRLPPLLADAQRVAATVAQGVHGRRRSGSGDAFWQFRQYQGSDPAHRIDWRQSAKSEQIYVRESEWEAAQTMYLWRDGSPSMHYSSAKGRQTKCQHAELLLLACAILLSNSGEHVTLLGTPHAPGHSRATIEQMAATLCAPPPPPEAGGAHQALPRPLDHRARPLPRHGATVWLGDFLGPLEDISRTIAAFAKLGVRGHLVQILDPAEETLPFAGRVEFKGLERTSPTALISRVETIRNAYLERLAAQRDGLQQIARTAGWSLSLHTTDHAPHHALLALCGQIAGTAAARRA